MSEEVIWELSIDGTSAVASIDEVSAALDALMQQISAVAAAADDLTALDDALSNVSVVTADATTATDGMSEALASMSQQINDDTAMISALNETIANLEGQIGVLTTEESAASDASGVLAGALSSVGEVASGVSEALQGAMGPLMLISGAAVMMGKSFLDAGRQGQDGIALVKGMAGASQQDIQNLEQSALDLGVNMKQATDGMYMVASAGYTGSQGILVLDNAIKAAKASNSQLGDVSSATTAILHSYNLTANDSGKVTDELIQTTIQGKQSFSDLASAIGPLAATGHAVGISFAQVVAAEATMTQINPHVKQDSVELQHLMNALAQDVDKTAKTAHGLGISFDETHYKSLDLMGKLEYLRKQTQGNDTAFTKLVGGTSGLAAALDLLSGKGTSYTKNLKAIQDSTGATEKKFEESQQTVSAHLDKMGAAFSVMATKAVEALGPKLIPIIDKVSGAIGQFTDFATHHIDQLMPVLAGLAAVIGTAIVGAITAFVISMGPVLPILAGIGLAVAGVVYAFQHWNDIMHQVQNVMQIPAIHETLKVLQGIGAFLVSAFTPVWQQLVSVFNTQLKPAWDQLVTAIKPLLPFLQALAVGIGAVLVVALGVAIAVIGGLIKAFANLVAGLAVAFGGVVQIVSGAMQIVAGIIRFIVDLATGNFKKLGGDLGAIWRGIAMMFSGIWNTIAGIFQAAFGAIGGFISGFIDTIVGYFQNLFDILVGHSIIPDMMTAIVGFFTNLPQQALDAIQALPDMLSNFFQGIINTAHSWGADIISNIANGIQSVIGKVQQAASNVANIISSILHHSKPEEGPLVDDDQWGAHFVENLAAGIDAQRNRIQTAAMGVAQSMMLAISAPTVTPPNTIASSSSLANQHVLLLSQILTVLTQMNAKSGNPAMPILMQNTINAQNTSNPQQIYNMLQSLGGYGYESMLRGSTGL